MEATTAALQEASDELAEARSQYATLTTWNSRKRDLAETIEFLSSKVAFLSVEVLA